MPDAGLIFPPGFRVPTDQFAAVNGGTIEFYVTGTSTPQTVYSDRTLTTSLNSVVYLDSGGHPVTSQGGSTKTLIYTGATSIKAVIKSSTGVTLASYDDVQFAQDTSGLGTGSGNGGVTGVVSKTADYTILAADDGKLFRCDPSGATFTMTLPSAATAGDRFVVGIQHAGTTTTNQVKILTVSGQTIALDNTTTTADALTGGGETMWLASNGSSWIAYDRTGPRLSHPQPVPVVDRVSAAPASPTAGAFYIVTSTPTGWPSGTAENDLMRANGQGSWIRYRPASDCGWLAFVQDENVNYQYQGSAWVALSNITAPAATALGLLIAKDVKATGTAGGASTSGSWQKHVLNTSDTATITGASLDTGTSQITLPTGTHHVAFMFACHNSGSVLGRIKSTTTATEIQGLQINTDAGTSDYVVGSGYLSVSAATEVFELQYYCTASKATNGLGLPHSIAATSEVYATVSILKLEASQGPQGAQGPQGTVVNNSYTVAALPSGSAGQVAYASNGRKNGEGGGLGTGVLVFHDGTAWRACDTGATVAA